MNIKTVLYLATSLSVLTGSRAFCQNGKISGLIIDSISRRPVEYATVSIVDDSRNRTITGTVTDTTGAFLLSLNRSGYYVIQIEAIGYSSFRFPVQFYDKNKFKILGRIPMSQKRSNLQTVTVTGIQKLIENKIDKMVFNAENDLTSQGGVLTDILKKIPQISVDADGNVELAGSSSIRFLIDGKPSTAFGSNITDVLQSIPASQIKSIEVITSPGAKYDGEGLGGIINIILKHNMVKGISGSLSLTVASRNENGAFNLSGRNGKWGITVFVDANTRLPATTILTSERISQDTNAKTQVVLNQDGNSRFYRYGVESGITIDYTLNKKNNLTFTLSNDYFGSTNSGLQNQSQITSDYQGTILGEILSLSQTDSKVKLHTTNLSLDYKKTFNKKDQEIELGVHLSKNKNTFNSVNTQYDQPGDILFYGTNNDNPGNETETEIAADYTQPLVNDMIWGVGSKMTFTDINSTSNVLNLQPVSGNYEYDSTLSNYLRYQQRIYALYSELNFPVRNWFDAKLGLRYERTELNPFFSDISQQISEPGYNTFLPSIFFNRKINERQSIRLSYSKRIERPDYRDLNPFINTTDPYNITTGNPYLQPEIGHRFELGWNHDLASGGSYLVSIFYRMNQNDIQPYVVYYGSLPVGDTVYKNVAVSTRQNIGTEKNLGINLFSDLHLTTKLNVRTNIFVFYRQGINALDSGLQVKSWNYRININLAYNFSTSLAGEFFANFNSPRNEIQGKYPSFSSYTLAFRKQIWKKKGSVAITATNIFSEYLNQATVLYGPNFTVNGLRQIPFRSIGINFTFKFGKLEFKKSKTDNIDATPASIE